MLVRIRQLNAHGEVTETFIPNVNTVYPFEVKVNWIDYSLVEYKGKFVNALTVTVEGDFDASLDSRADLWIRSRAAISI